MFTNSIIFWFSLLCRTYHEHRYFIGSTQCITVTDDRLNSSSLSILFFSQKVLYHSVVVRIEHDRKI